MRSQLQPLKRKCTKGCMDYFLQVFTLDGSFVVVLAVVAVGFAIAEVEIDIVLVVDDDDDVVLIVVFVVVVAPSLTSALLLWVLGILYCQEFIERQTNDGKNSSPQNKNL